MQSEEFKMERSVFPLKDGGLIFTDKVSWLGPVQKVKVTSGKKDSPVTRTVYKMLIRAEGSMFASADCESFGDIKKKVSDAFGSNVAYGMIDPTETKSEEKAE